MTLRSDLQPSREIERLFDLAGTRAVVTGAGRGLGRAAALALASYGADVVLFDVREEELMTTHSLVADTGVASRALVGDVTSLEDRASLVEIAAGPVPVTVVVNCAGVVRRSEIASMTLEDLDHMWNVNVRGTVAVTQAFLPKMIEARKGKVINMGSLGSVTGLDRRTAYATSKGGVALYTKSLACEVGCYGICVNAIAPGYIETDMTTDWISGDPERTARLLDRIPLGRFGTTEDMEGLLIFLASSASDYVTGQTIMLDGGWTTT
jgi:NAD(P)-dependent dehydrogenase (short-subunit alcohol dehydrogenase family)